MTMTSTTTTRAQRRAARRSTVQHLITADEHSLAELEALLATLPLCAAGRVFVEVPDAAHIAPITVPSRMTVTWLPRSARTGAPGTGRSCATGQAVSRAANAWASEMLCADAEADAAGQPQAQVTLLGGYLGTADIVEHLTDVLGVTPSSIHAPERFGLLPTL